MDPLELLVLMLVQKKILNDSELSWLHNSINMSQEQKNLVINEKDRPLTLESMKTLSFTDAHKEGLKLLKCPKCQEVGKLIDNIMTIDERPVLVTGFFECAGCKHVSHSSKVRHPLALAKDN